MTPGLPVGLIAGEGDFPVRFAAAARKKGHDVVACAVLGAASKEIESAATKTHWIKLGKIGKILGHFRDENVRDVVMCGRIRKEIFFKHPAIDVVGLKLLAALKDQRTGSILSAAADFLEREGFTVRSSVWALDEDIPAEGILTRRKPDRRERADVEFGVRMARALADLDIGQTVVVKDRIVVAAEAVEGTDETIERAGRIAGPGCVIVKMNAPGRDLRFDVPTIGPETLRRMSDAKASVLAVQAGQTLLLDKEKLINTANLSKISVIAVPGPDGTGKTERG
ncbi:UDP-2,3-diacylglucosamine diphosphatase LpxI [bacterium]|nr:UDP-2,3-diacylglucosamine diphosphatase LpxI [bacterium]